MVNSRAGLRIGEKVSYPGGSGVIEGFELCNDGSWVAHIAVPGRIAMNRIPVSRIFREEAGGGGD